MTALISLAELPAILFISRLLSESSELLTCPLFFVQELLPLPELEETLFVCPLFFEESEVLLLSEHKNSTPIKMTTGKILKRSASVSWCNSLPFSFFKQPTAKEIRFLLFVALYRLNISITVGIAITIPAIIE